jgi:hypothetical protein
MARNGCRGAVPDAQIKRLPCPGTTTLPTLPSPTAMFVVGVLLINAINHLAGMWGGGGPPRNANGCKLAAAGAAPPPAPKCCSCAQAE